MKLLQLNYKIKYTNKQAKTIESKVAKDNGPCKHFFLTRYNTNAISLNYDINTYLVCIKVLLQRPCFHERVSLSAKKEKLVPSKITINLSMLHFLLFINFPWVPRDIFFYVE
jgi:hypothetical protein